jgi:hypothetical protein
MNLVTDRTAQDVERVLELKNKGWSNMTAEEKAEWTAGMKGAYNSADLNRVQEATAHLNERLSAAGYVAEYVPLKTWGTKNVPTRTELETYLQNVRSIRDAFVVLDSTPAAPTTMTRFNYLKANAIEQILTDIDRLVTNMIASYSYSGECFGGEII